MANDAARTIVVGNWQDAGSYSRKCWEEIATHFISQESRAAFARPWEGSAGYRNDTESHAAFFPIPLAAPGSTQNERSLFRDALFRYFNEQNVTSLVLVCDSPFAHRTLEILGPFSTRPVFVAVASNEELLSSQVSAMAHDYLFRLCPNNRQQAELVLMKTRMERLSQLLFWTDEKEDSDEYRFHAQDLYAFLKHQSEVLDITVRKWTLAVSPENAALFVAGYSATMSSHERCGALGKATLVMFSDGCTKDDVLKKIAREREIAARANKLDRKMGNTFALRSSVEPHKIATETISFLQAHSDLTPRQLAAKLKSPSLLGNVPVEIHGTDNSAIPFHLIELRDEGDASAQ
jgi:hypothetical protein